MNFLRKLDAEWALRITLGAMYLYSGIDIVKNPKHWTWAVTDLPAFAQDIIANMFGAGEAGILRFLHIQGMVEIAIAVIFLAWFLPRVIVRWAGLLSALEMIAIVLMVGVSLTTFRDIGLIGPGLALFFMLRR